MHISKRKPKRNTKKKPVWLLEIKPVEHAYDVGSFVEQLCWGLDSLTVAVVRRKPSETVLELSLASLFFPGWSERHLAPSLCFIPPPTYPPFSGNKKRHPSRSIVVIIWWFMWTETPGLLSASMIINLKKNMGCACSLYSACLACTKPWI